MHAELDAGCEIEDPGLALKFSSHVLECYSPHTTLQLALGRDSVLGVERYCRPWYFNISTPLYNKLTGRQLSLPIAEYVALDASDKDNYYVRFEDGQSQWVGPGSMTKAIYGSDSPVGVVCFAPNGGWYASSSSILFIQRRKDESIMA